MIPLRLNEYTKAQGDFAILKRRKYLIFNLDFGLLRPFSEMVKIFKGTKYN